MINHQDNISRWHWNWRRPLFVQEKELLSQLSVTISSLEERKGFFVATIYNYLISLYNQFLETPIHSKFWESKVTSKVLVFSWRLLLGSSCMIPNLEVPCYFCNSSKETTKHLFLSCPKSTQIWLLIIKIVLTSQKEYISKQPSNFH